jgi:hypothetical protein
VRDWSLKSAPSSGISLTQGTPVDASPSVSTSSPPTTIVKPSGTVTTLESLFSWRGGGSSALAASPTKLESDTVYSITIWSPSATCGLTVTRVPASSVPPKLVVATVVEAFVEA